MGTRNTIATNECGWAQQYPIDDTVGRTALIKFYILMPFGFALIQFKSRAHTHTQSMAWYSAIWRRALNGSDDALDRIKTEPNKNNIFFRYAVGRSGWSRGRESRPEERKKWIHIYDTYKKKFKLTEWRRCHTHTHRLVRRAAGCHH